MEEPKAGAFHPYGDAWLGGGSFGGPRPPSVPANPLFVASRLIDRTRAATMLAMKQHVLLTIASLLSILFLTFHLADDIVRGFEQGGLSNLVLMPLVVGWLYAALILTERRSGYVINLLMSLLALGVPIIHMSGRGVGAGSRIANSNGAFFFVWTLIALTLTALFSVVLSARGLWNQRAISR